MEGVLDVRLDSFAYPVGYLSGDNRNAIAFTYSPEFLASPDAMDISLGLPLRQEPFGDVATRAYFDNLMPESDTARADVRDRYGLTNDDVVGILYHLGKDCPGAISVLPQGASPVKMPGDLAQDYVVLSDGELGAIVQALHDREPLPDVVRDPSLLAGVQSKIALTLLADGRYAKPIDGSGAPTTHILKVPDAKHHRDVKAEHLAMELSWEAEFPTATTQALMVGDLPVLLIKRFDRVVDEHGMVRRLHVEDFCQALGLPSKLKYERYGEPGRRFGAEAIGRLLDGMIDPLLEKQLFVRYAFFDLMIGNVDGHAKNFSLFHLPGGRRRTTPRYDVMPTALDRSTTADLAYRIGNAQTIPEITQADVHGFLSTLGYKSEAGRRRMLNRIVPELFALLDSQLDQLQKQGLKDFADLIGTNIRTLAGSLGFDVPRKAADRDTYVRDGI